MTRSSVTVPPVSKPLYVTIRDVRSSSNTHCVTNPVPMCALVTATRGRCSLPAESRVSPDCLTTRQAPTAPDPRNRPFSDSLQHRCSTDTDIRPSACPGNRPQKRQKPIPCMGFRLVGATGFEPVTSAVSRQRSAAELSARDGHCIPPRRRRESNPGRGFCRPLPHHSATSPRPQSAMGGRNRPSSGRPDSNRRPQPWQGCALPAELRPRCGGWYHGAA